MVDRNLDSFPTEAELVAWTAASGVQICPPLLGSPGRPGAGHISTAGASRDSTIVEFIEGRAMIYNGRQFTDLPGTTDAADRFAPLTSLRTCRPSSSARSAPL